MKRYFIIHQSIVYPVQWEERSIQHRYLSSYYKSIVSNGERKSTHNDESLRQFHSQIFYTLLYSNNRSEEEEKETDTRQLARRLFK